MRSIGDGREKKVGSGLRYCDFYSYVENDPVNKIDPLGLALKDIGIFQTDDPWEADKVRRDSETLPDSYPAEDAPAPDFCTEGDCSAPDDSGGSDEEAAPWPTGTHDDILDTTLPELRDVWMDEMKSGSRSIDVDEKTGFPITLIPELAWQHGMVPGPWVAGYIREGYTPEQAVAKATERAKKQMAAWRDNLLNQSMNDFAKGNIKASMKKFGKAMHPVMDAESPEHSWKVYSLHIIPHVEVVRQIMHAWKESGPPTNAQMNRMVSTIRHHFGMTVSRDFYAQALSKSMSAPSKRR